MRYNHGDWFHRLNPLWWTYIHLCFQHPTFQFQSHEWCYTRLPPQPQKVFRLDSHPRTSPRNPNHSLRGSGNTSSCLQSCRSWLLWFLQCLHHPRWYSLQSTPVLFLKCNHGQRFHLLYPLWWKCIHQYFQHPSPQFQSHEGCYTRLPPLPEKVFRLDSHPHTFPRNSVH